MNFDAHRSAQQERDELYLADTPYMASMQSQKSATDPYTASSMASMAEQVISATLQTAPDLISAASPLSACGYPLSLDTGKTPPAGRPLRVVHVGPCMLRGGAEQWLTDLARFLDPSSIQLVESIVTQPDQIDLRLVSELPFPVRVGKADIVRKAASECDVLLSWGLELADLLGDVRPTLSVFLAHGDGDWTNAMLTGSQGCVDHVVAVSQRVASLCCQGSPTSVIWNGVDSARLGCTDSREATRTALGFGREDFVLGYVGRFSPEKRPDVLIEAVAKLPPHFKLLIVGWGPLRHDLMELANSRIPGRYAFTTAWKYLGDYYRAVDALGITSDQEGFPLVMLEAMMCGCPVIATSVGCVPEVIQDRINGLIVSGQPSSVAKAAMLLHRHPIWAHALGEEGRCFAEQYGHARRMARDYENLFHRLWVAKHGQT